MNLTPTHYGAAATAVSGVIIWALTYYAHMPPAVGVPLAAVLPGIVGGVTGYLTRAEAKQPQPPAKVSTPTT